MKRVCTATGAMVQTTVNGLNTNPELVLGSCDVFEEKQVGNERFNIFRGCPGSKSATIVLRGGAEQVITSKHGHTHLFIHVCRKERTSFIHMITNKLSIFLLDLECRMSLSKEHYQHVIF